MPNSFRADDYTLSPEELDRIFSSQVAEYLFGASPVARDPALILVGGQPGAGKTRAGAAAVREAQQVVTAVVGDELRAFHPAYTELLELHPTAMPDGTAQASGAWVRRACGFAARNRRSILVEGTFRDPGVVLATADECAAAGFRVEAHLIAVSPEVSHVGMGLRFVADSRAGSASRFTKIEAHAASFFALPRTLGVLASAGAPVDRMVVRSREELLLSVERTPGRSIRGARSAAGAEWNRPQTDGEFSCWTASAGDIAAFMVEHLPEDRDAQNLVRQLDYDRRYLEIVRSGEVAVRGHVRSGGDVIPHTRGRPARP